MTITTPKPTRAPNLRERYDVLASSGFRCDYCGRGKADGARLSVDHVVARAAGGGHARGTLMTSCTTCNQGKADRPIPYPRWERIGAERWDRCECSGGPAALEASPTEPMLLCTACRYPAFQRIFGAAR